MKNLRGILLGIIILILFVAGCTLKQDQKPVIQLVEPNSDIIDSGFNFHLKISDDVYLKGLTIMINNSEKIEVVRNPEFSILNDGLDLMSSFKINVLNDKSIELISLKPYPIDEIPDGEILHILITAEDNIDNKTELEKDLKVVRKPIIKLLPSEEAYDTVEGTFDIMAYIKDIDAEGKEDLSEYSINLYHKGNLIDSTLSPVEMKYNEHDKDATVTTQTFEAYRYPVGDTLELKISATDRASNTVTLEKEIKVGGKAPEITIIKPNMLSSGATIVNIEAMVTDDVEIKSVRLLVNDVDINGDIHIKSLDAPALTLDEFKKKEYVKKVFITKNNVELKDSETRIIIEAEDRAGNIVSKGFKIVIVNNENSPTKRFKIVKEW
ncbi:hypothetical protein Marpi_1520 [Marinitoga piezophila KA3]|uniref:Uncharacterized protein n=1 Tax=Marinitoga piezophila (strain DSM 14283 / JCM 11233 / KA3) TaxID=443254 RepID=H2J499_MARPK|nr:MULTISPECIES: Ig-like domain-containing protein [Marinitoga]AEX85914.1 hypothetical protein Marpi_1520 [Marinitoga piezophila KA3]APT76345.1 hypothetical protein LN42_08105 [Marinitoga sp. 1137]NUU98025.1 hypothetical protein [Marinitoga sp. 1138]